MLNSSTSETIFRSWNVLQNVFLGCKISNEKAHLWRKIPRAALHPSVPLPSFPIRLHPLAFPLPLVTVAFTSPACEAPGHAAIIKRANKQQNLLKEWRIPSHTPIPTCGNGTQPARNPKLLHSVIMHLVTTSLVSNCPCGTAHRQNHPIPASHIHIDQATICMDSLK